MSRNVFEQDFQYEACDRVQVARERVAAQPERLKRNGATTRKRIDNERRLICVGCLKQPTPDFQVPWIGGKVPTRKIADEPEQRLLKVRIMWPRFALDCGEQYSRFVFEVARAALVARVGQ
jgi:hypothetical protein